MCLGVGAPGGVKTETDQQGALFSTAINQAQQEFGDSSTIFNDLKSAFEPIAEAGPSQQGWSPAELSLVNSASISNVGNQYKAANTAVKEAAAAAGGGNVVLPSGAAIAPKLQLSASAANETASELNSNLVKDYQQGNENWKFATEGLAKAPDVFNTANSAVNVADTTGMDALKGQQIRSSYPTWSSMAMGAIGDVASMATGGLENLDTTGSSTGGEQVGNFLGGL